LEQLNCERSRECRKHGKGTKRNGSNGDPRNQQHTEDYLQPYQGMNQLAVIPRIDADQVSCIHGAKEQLGHSSGKKHATDAGWTRHTSPHAEKLHGRPGFMSFGFLITLIPEFRGTGPSRVITSRTHRFDAAIRALPDLSHRSTVSLTRRLASASPRALLRHLSFQRIRQHCHCDLASSLVACQAFSRRMMHSSRKSGGTRSLASWIAASKADAASVFS
jgi:hypothetical protein